MLPFSKARAWVFSAAIGVTALSASARADVLFDSLDSENSEIVGSPALAPEFDASFHDGGFARSSERHCIIAQLNIFPSGRYVHCIGFRWRPARRCRIHPGPWAERRLPGGPALASVTLPISDLSPNLTVEHFSQFDGLQLQANTFYWIDLTGSGQSPGDLASLGWGVTNDNSGPGVAEGYNSSQITDFGFFPNAPTPPPNNGGPIFQMEVSAAAAPEPSTWALMLMGLAGLGLVAHRRRTGKPA